ARKIEAGVRVAEVEVRGNELRAKVLAQPDLPALKTEAQAALKAGEADDALRMARNRKKSQNNLKQIGIALHTHHDTMGLFPAAAIADRGGKPLLSWRVAILPYIEQQALYNQFKRDEPWDSEHNKKLLAKMPAIYAPLGVKAKEPFMTFYQAFV